MMDFIELTSPSNEKIYVRPHFVTCVDMNSDSLGIYGYTRVVLIGNTEIHVKEKPEEVIRLITQKENDWS